MEKEVREMMQVVQCEASSVWLREGDVIFPYIFLGPNARAMEGIEMPYDKGVCGFCITHNEEIISNQLGKDTRWNLKVDEITGFRSENVICLPLCLYGEVYGCVELLNKKGGFQKEDVAVCRKITNYILETL